MTVSFSESAGQSEGGMSERSNKEMLALLGLHSPEGLWRGRSAHVVLSDGGQGGSWGSEEPDEQGSTAHSWDSGVPNTQALLLCDLG